MGLVLEFDRFWDAVEHCNHTIKLNQWPKKNDQWLLGMVKGCAPEIMAECPHPSPWSVHLGHSYQRTPQHLSSEPNRTVGMVHLQSWAWLLYQAATSRIELGKEGFEIELVFREAGKNAVHLTNNTKLVVRSF